jgi:tetraacyldisaccharide 4'-kinase
MKPVLLVTNGHGELAIASRIAAEIRRLRPDVDIDHFGLVSNGAVSGMRDVGPRKAMPSGGLIAMGNLRNIVRDVASGLLALSADQYRFLRSVRGTYGAAAAIGDVFALVMTLAARTPTVFVGTAKSVSVAPYGRFEERILRRARARFVRDAATATRLQEHGLAAEAANVIADLFDGPDDARAQEAVAGFSPAVVLLPGSRERAYDDAIFLLRLVRELAGTEAGLGAVLSVAPSLDADRFARLCSDDGWEVQTGGGAIPFALRAGSRTIVRAWNGALGSVLQRVDLAFGQAGTANEAAAAAGVAVVAFEPKGYRNSRWYRRRQSGLLGDALLVLPNESAEALAETRELLHDRPRRARMGAVGRQRMDAAGGARAIAERIVAIASDA